MLQMTREAALTLNQAREREGLPEHYGVRIFATADPNTDGSQSQSGAVGLGFVDGPQAGDAVGEVEGTNYFVAPEIAETLDGAVIDIGEAGNLVLTRGV